MKNEMLTNYVSLNDLNIFLEKIMDQIGGDNVVEAVKLINSGKVVVANIKTWKEKKCFAFFSVTSDGASGPQWISRLSSKGIAIDDFFKSRLLSDDFKPTSGVTTKLTVIKSEFEREEFKNLSKKVQENGLKIPSWETLCLVRENFSALQIVEMCHGVLIINEKQKEDGFFGLNGWLRDRIPGIYLFKSYDCDYAGKLFEIPAE